MLLELIPLQDEALESGLSRARCSEFSHLKIECAERGTHPAKEVEGRSADAAHGMHEALLLVSGEVHG